MAGEYVSLGKECDASEIRNNSNNLTVTSTLSSPTIRALMNDVIVGEIFNFLSFADCKHFRLVCKKWQSVVDPGFKKRSIVRFHFGKYDKKSVETSLQMSPPPEDIITFFKAADEPVPFTNLRLGYQLIWSESKLRNFFAAKEGKCIQQLSFEDVALPIIESDTQEKKVHNCYNLFSLTSGHLQNLHRLKIQVDHWECKTFTRFTMSLDDLEKIKFIHLEKCTITLTNKVIAPVELMLRDITFNRNGVDVESSGILLNDFVNFKKIVDLQVYLFTPELPTPITLDMCGAFNIKSVSLMRVGLLNVDISNWKVEVLHLIDMLFLVKNNFTMKTFSIQQGKCKLSYLPQSIEKLRMGGIVITDTNKWTPHLPDLKTLEIKGEECVRYIFPLLNMFGHLEVLHIDYYTMDNPYAIDLNMFPASLKKLFLTGGKYDFAGNTVLNLDTLVLTPYGLPFDPELIELMKLIEKSTANFKINNLLVNIIDLNSKHGCRLIATLLNKPIARVVVGTFKWAQGELLEHSEIGKYVHCLGEVYSFQNGICTVNTMRSMLEDFHINITG